MKFKKIIESGISEFLNKGLTWARVLLVSFWMSAETFGLLALILAWEGIIAGLLSFPIVRDVLSSHYISTYHISKLLIAISILTIPYFSIGVCLDADIIYLFVVYFSFVFTALWRVFLTLLRVYDISIHNLAKTISAVLSSILFVVLIPLNASFLPVVNLLSVAIVYLFFLRINFGSVNHQPDTIKKQIINYLIFGSQAVLNNIPAYGLRIYIGLYISSAAVGVYTKNYMLATGLFFVYTAIMIVYEPALTKRDEIKNVYCRLYSAIKIVLLMLGMGILYYVLLYVFNTTVGFTAIDIGFTAVNLADFDISIILIFTLFIFFNGVATVQNCFVVALEQQLPMLFISIIGVVALVMMLLVLEVNELENVAWMLLAYQFILTLMCSILVAYTFFTYKNRVSSV